MGKIIKKLKTATKAEVPAPTEAMEELAAVEAPVEMETVAEAPAETVVEAATFGMPPAKKRPVKGGSSPCFEANKPTNCKACGKDLLALSLTYTIKDLPDAFCSRSCRATVTGETVRVVDKPASATSPATNEAVPLTRSGKEKPATLSPRAAAATAKAALNAPKGDAPVKPKKEGAGRATSAPWSNLDGKLHLTDKPAKFQEASIRGQVFKLIVNGMTVRDLYAQCDKAGLDGKGSLAKIIGVFGCAEVR